MSKKKTSMMFVRIPDDMKLLLEKAAQVTIYDMSDIIRDGTMAKLRELAPQYPELNKYMTSTRTR